jgi:hypothetical protein
VREYANPHSRECHPAAPTTTHSISNSHVSGTVELIIGRHNLDEEASASERTHFSADVQLLARPVGDGGRGASRACSLLRVGTETELLFAAARQRRRRRRCGGFEPRASLSLKKCCRRVVAGAGNIFHSLSPRARATRTRNPLARRQKPARVGGKKSRDAELLGNGFLFCERFQSFCTCSQVKVNQYSLALPRCAKAVDPAARMVWKDDLEP